LKFRQSKHHQFFWQSKFAYASYGYDKLSKAALLAKMSASVLVDRVWVETEKNTLLAEEKL
jgi:hypothetical protein